MNNKVRAVVRGGKLELLDRIEIPEGANVVITIVSEDDSRFWMNASEGALDAIWGNAEDDVYAELLKK